MISFQGELLVRHAVRGHQPVVRTGHRLRRPLLPARLLQAAGEERLRIPREALRPQGQVKKFVFCTNYNVQTPSATSPSVSPPHLLPRQFLIGPDFPILNLI